LFLINAIPCNNWTYKWKWCFSQWFTEEKLQ
jgi:hypothetical protein